MQIFKLSESAGFIELYLQRVITCGKPENVVRFNVCQGSCWIIGKKSGKYRKSLVSENCLLLTSQQVHVGSKTKICSNRISSS